MGVNKHNAEGYLDLTAYEAISNAVREEKKPNAKRGKSRQRQRENRRKFVGSSAEQRQSQQFNGGMPNEST
ncbi:MAG: hypothetical protein PHV18_00205 [Lachnospiraceae bacterium]|nr:hypothetical protein [Lachnospiraceae bacterium]